MVVWEMTLGWAFKLSRLPGDPKIADVADTNRVQRGTGRGGGPEYIAGVARSDGSVFGQSSEALTAFAYPPPPPPEKWCIVAKSSSQWQGQWGNLRSERRKIRALTAGLQQCEQAVSGLTRIDGSAWIAIASDWECVC